jgi:tetratricopeptide (TPR) repeat protein
VPALPRSGTLAGTPLPRLLLALWHESFSGLLHLARERLAKRVQLEAGVPVLSESNVAGESLGEQLLAAEKITPDDRARLREHSERQGIDEPAALLELGLLSAADLVSALREQVRRRLVDCFAWPDGDFRLEPGQALGQDAQAFRVDPLRIVQDGIATHWSPERVLSELGERLSQHPIANERFAALAARLARDPDGGSLVKALDPARTFGEAVYASLTPGRLGAAWVLAESGGLDFASSAPPEEEPPEDPAGGEPELQFVFETSGAAGPESAPEAAGSTARSAEVALSPEAEALRKEILARHERIDEVDFYEVLGIGADAADAAVKQAYFALAKRFHPDAVSRAGLGSLHREANELFARIAQAYQTLSNPKRRKAYDDSRHSGGPSVDARRVAQAETLFRKGEVLLKVGNFTGALDFLRPCVELWPEEADYQGALGWALYKKPKPDVEAARTHLERANQLKADDPVLLFRLGMVLRKLGDDERASTLLDRAKSLEKAKG